MARTWRLLPVVLSLIFFSRIQAASIATESPPESENDFDTGYLIVVPKIFVAETEETICISLQNMTGPLEVAIRLMDNTTVLAKLPLHFMEFRMACYEVQVPAIEEETLQATLVIKMRRTLVTQKGFEVVEKKLITISSENTEMFIETDKPVYKPGQTVKFRIININQDLKPDLSPVSKIWIEAPNGVRMQQWRNEQGTDGLIDLEMPMTPDPVQGTWSINAIHKGKKTTKSFEVDEYVLPKFEVIVTPPTFVTINETNIRMKICGRYTYGQPVRGSLEARITVKSEGWNSRERRTLTRRVEDTGPSGCSDIPVDVARLELNSTDFSLWNARLSIEVDYTETSTGVVLSATSESSKITRDALKLRFDAPNIFKPGVPYYGKIFVTYPDGRPAANKMISLSCNSDQGKIFDKNFTSPETGAIEFTVTDINITATSLNLYAFAPGFAVPTQTFGHSNFYTLHDPATSHYARPQYSPTGSFLQLAPIRGVAAVGSEHTLRIDYTANDPEDNFRFRFVVMSRGNIIPTRFYRAHKRPKRQAEGEESASANDVPSAPSVTEEPSVDGPSVDGPSVDGPSMGGDERSIELGSVASVASDGSEAGSLQFHSVPLSLVLDGSSFSSDFSFVPPTDPPVIIVEPGDLYSRELNFRVTPDMVPETRILAYYIRLDGEVVADSIAFTVQKKFENEVDITFSDEERMPGAETQIVIRASPGSLCAVGVVDRSVHILGGDNQLKADKIFASLDRYQLTHKGGYLEPSRRCEPSEDEYPQFFPLGRKKRGIFLPGYGARYQDSSRAFKDMGLIYISNMDVETSPCVGGVSVARGEDGLEDAAEGPIAVPLAVRDEIDVDNDAILEKADIPSNVLETAPRIRSYFPETWLWDLRRTDSVTGEASISMEVPDTVTEWIGSGFCTSSEYGVGLSLPTKLRAFQPFFLSYTLPYSVVLREVVPVRVTVFNYLTESLVVEVSLERTDDFKMAKRSRSRQKVCVGGSQSQTVEFRIIPTVLGSIALQALGLSVTDGDALCGNELVSSRVGARDIIYKELLVEAEGTEVETTHNCYFCPEASAQQRSNLVAAFQNVNVNWQTDNYRSDGLSDMRVTAILRPDTGTDTIHGNRLWRLGLYASDSSRGDGPKYAYRSNILDESTMQTTLWSTQDLSISGETTFDLREICEIRNKHPYFCVEFAKNNDASVPFTVPIQGGVIKVCSTYTCPESAGQGPVARYVNFSASIEPYSVRSSGQARMTLTLNVNPAVNTDTISGTGLWRVGVFASNDATGESRFHENRNILDYLAAKKYMAPNRQMALEGSFNFPAGDLGCTYRYLCIEFAKGDTPSTDFSMQSSVSCQRKTCEGGGSGGPTTTGNPQGGSGGTSGGSSGDPTVRIRSFSWAVETTGTRPDGSSTLNLESSVSMDPSQSPFGGRGTRDLWKLGIFTSSDSRGTDRFDENEQLLRGDERSLEIRQGVPNVFTTRTRLDMRAMGCSTNKRFLCIEFGQGDNPRPSYSMVAGRNNDNSVVSCKRQECTQEQIIRVNSVRPTSPSTIEIREGVENEVTFNVDVRYDRTETTRIQGSNLWKIQAWGSRTAGDTNPKVSASDQVLSSFQEDNMLTPGEDFRFMGVSHTFDMRQRTCSDMKFLCVRLQKDNPQPTFRLLALSDDADNLVGCVKVRCVAAPKPQFTVTTIGIVRDPFGAVRAGQTNSMTLDVSVNYDQKSTTDLQLDPSWALEAFGSSKKNGKGRKVAATSLRLGSDAHRHFNKGGVLRFNNIPYDFNLASQTCSKAKFLCLTLSKTGTGFALKGKPRKALTKCVSVSCINEDGTTAGSRNPRPKPPRGGNRGNTGETAAGPSTPQVHLSSTRANFTFPRVNPDGNSPVSLTYYANSADNSAVPRGPQQWYLSVYGSDNENGAGHNKLGQLSNVLSIKQSKTTLVPGGEMVIRDISFNFPISQIGCHPYTYLCLEFGKGSSTKYEMVTPSSGRIVSCQARTCRT